MTWLTTWPSAGCVPHFAEHTTERQAEHHATQIVKSGVALVATAFWSEGDEHREAASEGAGGVVVVGVDPSCTDEIQGRQIGSERTGDAA